MTALPSSGTFTQVDPTHVAALGPAAAILFARIAWRAEATGEWRATRRMLQQETGLTEPMIRTAITVLREAEWIETRRTSPEDATLIWTPIHAGHADIAESARGVRIPPPPPAESAISSLETVDTSPPTPSGEDGLFSPPALRAVPDAPEPPAKTPRRAHRLPADYRPKQAHWDLAASLGVDLRHEGPQFRDHHTAKGSTMKDWDAALRTWIRNAAKFAAERGGPPPPVPTPGETYDPSYAAALPPPVAEPRSWAVR